MDNKILPIISYNVDLMCELSKDGYMNKNNVAESIEVYFAVDLKLLEDISKLDKVFAMHENMKKVQLDDNINQAILRNYTIDLIKENIFIPTTCLVQPRLPGDELELNYNQDIKNTCLSLTIVFHDNEEDVFGKLFRKPIYYKNKKSNYKLWAITKHIVMEDYLNMQHLLNRLRMKLILDIRNQLKCKNTSISLDMHKYNPLPLLRMIRFLLVQYSRTNISIGIVQKNDLIEKAVKNPLSGYSYYNLTAVKE